jgi:hypothetical protein
LNFGDTNGSVDKLPHERARKCINSMFGCTVDATPSVGFSTGDRAKVNDMSRLPLLEFYDAEWKLRPGLKYAPLMNTWVRAIKPNTLVANMFSMLSRDRSPTLSTPTTYPALLTATEFMRKKIDTMTDESTHRGYLLREDQRVSSLGSH